MLIQSEVSQKEKNKYRMLTHIYGIKKKMVLKNGLEGTGRGKTGQMLFKSANLQQLVKKFWRSNR